MNWDVNYLWMHAVPGTSLPRAQQQDEQCLSLLFALAEIDEPREHGSYGRNLLLEVHRFVTRNIRMVVNGHAPAHKGEQGHEVTGTTVEMELLTK